MSIEYVITCTRCAEVSRSDEPLIEGWLHMEALDARLGIREWHLCPECLTDFNQFIDIDLPKAGDNGMH